MLVMSWFKPKHSRAIWIEFLLDGSIITWLALFKFARHSARGKALYNVEVYTNWQTKGHMRGECNTIEEFSFELDAVTRGKLKLDAPSIVMAFGVLETKELCYPSKQLLKRILRCIEQAELGRISQAWSFGRT